MSRLPEKEEWAAYESAQESKETIEKALPILRQIDAILHSFEAHISVEIDENADANRYELIDTHAWFQGLKAVGNELLCRFANLYSLIERSPFNAAANSSNGLNSGTGSESRLGVSVNIFDGILTVKTPLLLNRNATTRSVHGKAFIADYNDFFSLEIEKAMRELETEIRYFPEKNISVISVYADEKRRLPDAENLDSKKIIDAILHGFPGADSGKYCSYFSACIHSEEIAEGAYFLITEGFGSVPDIKTSTDFLKSHYPSNAV